MCSVDKKMGHASLSKWFGPVIFTFSYSGVVFVAGSLTLVLWPCGSEQNNITENMLFRQTKQHLRKRSTLGNTTFHLEPDQLEE